MKFLFWVLLLISFSVFGQEIAAVETPVSTVDFLSILVQSVGGFKGASALVAAGLIVKVLLSFMQAEFFSSLFPSFKGGKKLTLVMLLSFISGLIALVSSGVSWGAALVHSTTLSAFVVLSDNVYKHWLKKE